MYAGPGSTSGLVYVAQLEEFPSGIGNVLGSSSGLSAEGDMAAQL